MDGKPLQIVYETLQLFQFSAPPLPGSERLPSFKPVVILTIIGLLISVSFLGSKVFQRLGIPQVVGFIVIGVALGPSLLNIVPPS